MESSFGIPLSQAPSKADEKALMQRTIADMQAEVHHLQMRVKDLVEENAALKEQLKV